jgi:hypothetical protein
MEVEEEEGISSDPGRLQPSLDPLCQPLGGRDGAEGGGQLRVLGTTTHLGVPGLSVM